MKKTNLLQIFLLTSLTVSLTYAADVMCYKENLNSISKIDTAKLDGTYCKGEKTLNDMKNESWIIDDIKVSHNKDTYSFIYIFKKNDLQTDNISLEKKINTILDKKEISKKPKVFTKTEKLSLGKKAYQNKCSTCHGQNADKVPLNSTRLIDVERFEYFEKMHSYDMNDNTSFSAKQMNDIVPFLKDSEIDNISIYIESLKVN